MEKNKNSKYGVLLKSSLIYKAYTTNLPADSPRKNSKQLDKCLTPINFYLYANTL